MFSTLYRSFSSYVHFFYLCIESSTDIYFVSCRYPVQFTDKLSNSNYYYDSGNGIQAQEYYR